MKRVDIEGRADLRAERLTEADVVAWGRRIGEAVAAGDVALPLVLALRGELGAGKSVLARAVARGAGVTSPMPSPTFNLVFRYEGAAGIEVYHVDLYRLEDPDEVWELGWRDLGSGRQIVLIEWPERAESLLPPDRWDVRLADEERQAGAGAETEVDVRPRGSGTGHETAAGAPAGRGAGEDEADLRWAWGTRRGDAPEIPRPGG